MAEDQKTPELKKDVVEAARESRADMFLQKAREARAKAEIEEEYSPDEALNMRVDSYINESAANLGDRLFDKQKEFLGTLIFTAAEKEGEEPWVIEGERRISDKSLDEARLAGLLVIDKVEGKKLPSGMKASASDLRKNIGKMTKEEKEERMKTIEDWKNEKGRRPVDLKKYEEWEQRWKMIERYNERLRLSEALPEKAEVAEPKVEKPAKEEPRKGRWERFVDRWDRFVENWDKFLYGPPEEKEEVAAKIEEPLPESGLSRAMASLAESKDILSWGNARLASQRAELEKRIEEQMKKEGRAEVPEDEMEEQAKARAVEEEQDLSGEEKEDLEKGEKGGEESLDAFSLVFVEFAERLKTGDLSSLEVQEALAGFFGREVKPAEELGSKAVAEEEAGELKFPPEQEAVRRGLRKFLGMDQKEIERELQKLADGSKGLREFAGEVFAKSESREHHKVRRVFYERLRDELKDRGYDGEVLEEASLKDLQAAFNEAAEAAMDKDFDEKEKRLWKTWFWMTFLSNWWNELKQGVQQGVGEGT